MTTNMKGILGQLERGEIDSDEAILQIRRSRNTDRVGYLWVQVHDMTSDRAKFHLRLPLRFLKAGLDIGAIYAPEINDLDFEQLINDIESFTDGSLLEVEDFESREKLIISITQE
jgi:hypothetical protein